MKNPKLAALKAPVLEALNQSSREDRIEFFSELAAHTGVNAADLWLMKPSCWKGTLEQWRSLVRYLQRYWLTVSRDGTLLCFTWNTSLSDLCFLFLKLQRSRPSYVSEGWVEFVASEFRQYKYNLKHSGALLPITRRALKRRAAMVAHPDDPHVPTKRLQEATAEILQLLKQHA